ncbi:hypothetical protein RCL1_005210 [Eukaryota sp. TZLM3-RCL]
MAGNRLLLAHQLESSVVLLKHPHQEKELLQNKLLVVNEIEQLANIHWTLLFGRGESFGTIGIDFNQDKNSLFSNLSMSSEFSSAGLHVNLEHFMLLARRIATSFTEDNDIDFQSFVDQSNVIGDYLYSSLSLFRDYAVANVSKTLNIVATFFVFLLVLLVAEYFFVYRKMVNTLAAEEDTVMLVLSMIPRNVIDNVPVIKGYLDSIGF